MYILNLGVHVDLFEEMTLFDVSLLTNLQKVIKAEHDRVEEEKNLDEVIFNHSNCQCAGEAYEFGVERRLKTEFQNDFAALGAELLIIGLFKQCEVYFKILIKEYHSDKSNSVKKTLKTYNASLPHYDAFDELRLLNNCIKHSGLVSNSLANRYPIWVADQPLGDMLPVYERLIQNVRRFVGETENYIKTYT